MRDQTDEAAFQIVMAELARRGVTPKALSPAEPNAPDILVVTNGREHHLRVKGFDGPPSPRWRCVKGRGTKVFPAIIDPHRDFVIIVGISTSTDQWFYLRRTAEVEEELAKHGRDHRPTSVSFFRELRFNMPELPTYYDSWQPSRNAWHLLGVPQLPADAA